MARFVQSSTRDVGTAQGMAGLRAGTAESRGHVRRGFHMEKCQRPRTDPALPLVTLAQGTLGSAWPLWLTEWPATNQNHPERWCKFCPQPPLGQALVQGSHSPNLQRWLAFGLQVSPIPYFPTKVRTEALYPNTAASKTFWGWEVPEPGPASFI